MSDQREKSQRKAFLNFLNTLLDKESKINTLDQMVDGVIFLKCLEALTGKTFRYTKICRNVFQKVENVNSALKFLENDCKIKMINIDANNITKGNEKIILALIWHIILHFKISKAFASKGSKDDNSATSEMMAWLNEKSGSSVRNFTEDWMDGLKLKALISSLRKKIDPNVESYLVGSNAIELNNSCLSYAEIKMNIPALLTGEDISSAPDKLAMMTYLSYFREYEQTIEDVPPTPPVDTTKFEEEKNTLEAEIVSLKTQVEELRNQNKKLQVENETLATKQKSSNDILSSLESELEQQKLDNQTIRKEVERLKSTNEGYLLDIEDITKLNSELLKKIAELEEIVDSQKKTIQSLENQHEEIVSKNKELSLNSEDVNRKYDKIQTENNNLKNEIESLDQQYKKKIQDFEALESENAHLKDDIDKLQLESASNSTDNDTLREQIGQLNIDNETLRKENEKIKQTLNDYLGMLKETISEVEIQKQLQIEELNTNNDNEANFKEVLELSKKVIDEQENTIAALENQLVEMKFGFECG